MKKLLVLVIFGLLATPLLFSADEEIETTGWYVKFTVPYSDSTVYTLGQSTKSLTVQWVVNTNGSTLYKIRYYMDGNQYHYGQGTSYNQSFSIGSHTLLVKLVVYNTAGQEIVVSQEQRILTVNYGHYIYYHTNFDGGYIHIDNVMHYTNYIASYMYVIPGIHIFSASQNQTGHDGKSRVWDRWTDGFYMPTWSDYNREHSHNIVTDGLDFAANYLVQPSVPTNFALSTQGWIRLSWSAIPEPVDYYEVWRRRIPGGFELISTTTELSFTDPEYATGGNINLLYKIRAKGANGVFSDYTETVGLSNAAPYKHGEDIVQLSETPGEFGLNQNYPNPFNPATEISYAVPEPSFVTLSVFNSVGQEIAQLVKEFKGGGNYSVTWNASGLPSGVYFYSMKAGKFSSIKKMVLAK